MRIKLGLSVAFVLLTFLLWLSTSIILDQVEKNWLVSPTATVQVERVKLCANKNLYHEFETGGSKVVILWFPSDNYLEVFRGDETPEIISIEYLNEAKIDFGDVLLFLDYSGCPPT